MFVRVNRRYDISKLNHHQHLFLQKGLAYLCYLAFGTSLLLLVSCGTTNTGGNTVSKTTLTQADKGKTIDVHSGTQIIIHVQENPTTGYRWAIDQNNTAMLPLESSTYATTSGGGVGSGGTRTFTFTAKQPGTVHLQLKLWRAWQGNSSITQHYDVTINVQS